MSLFERTPVRLVAAALAGALACGLVLARAHGASAATQFHHTARSPEFFINGGQNASVSTLNVGTTRVTCSFQARSLDNHVLASNRRSSTALSRSAWPCLSLWATLEVTRPGSLSMVTCPLASVPLPAV